MSLHISAETKRVDAEISELEQRVKDINLRRFSWVDSVITPWRRWHIAFAFSEYGVCRDAMTCADSLTCKRITCGTTVTRLGLNHTGNRSCRSNRDKIWLCAAKMYFLLHSYVLEIATMVKNIHILGWLTRCECRVCKYIHLLCGRRPKAQTTVVRSYWMSGFVQLQDNNNAVSF